MDPVWKQRDIWAHSLFVKGRDRAPITELLKLIMRQSGSSSDSKIDSNTNSGEIQNPGMVTREVRTSEIRIWSEVEAK